MNIEHVKTIADAVLYEGYILYPYRPSATKNHQRWMFGELYPTDDARSGGESSTMRAEMLIEGEASTTIDIVARFLQNRSRQVGELSASGGAKGAVAHFRATPSLVVDGEPLVSFDEALERQVDVEPMTLSDLLAEPTRLRFSFPATREFERVRSRSGEIVAGIARSSETVEGEIVVSVVMVGDRLFRVSVEIANVTPLADPASLSRRQAQAHAFLSTHLIIGAGGGAFVSLLDPPERFRDAAAACASSGLWPTLVGEAGRRDMMLASPIILYDYPKIAPESHAAFFDGAEIDELLTLRVRTLTDAEKKEMAAADPRAREILERCERMTPEELAALHGAFRPIDDEAAAQLAVGERVRIHPRAGGDIMDIALCGRVAVIASIERDFEGRAHVAVTLEDDPGADLGAVGFPGHRFFFSPQELEPLEGGAP